MNYSTMVLGKLAHCMEEKNILKLGFHLRPHNEINSS